MDDANVDKLGGGYTGFITNYIVYAQNFHDKN
jgi:hypothetical protein